MTESNLVRTGAAARAVGVTTQTLLAWREEGRVRAEYKTPGAHGQYRWSLEKLFRQLGLDAPNPAQGRTS